MVPYNTIRTMTNENHDRYALWSTDQIAQHMGVSKKHILKLVGQRKLRCLRISPKVYRFRPEEVMEDFAKMAKEYKP